MPEHLRAAVLLGAFAGLRTAEACGLRIADVDFMRGVINPAVQYPADPLKTEASRSAIPIPRSLANTLSAHVAQWRHPGLPGTGDTLLADELGEQLGPWRIEHAMQDAREALAERDAKALAEGRTGDVVGLPEAFRYHDLRHYFASLLIARGADVKAVQARLRHASAKTTLDVYGHLWPDSDESTRAAVEAVLAARADYMRTRVVVSQRTRRSEQS